MMGALAASATLASQDLQAAAAARPASRRSDGAIVRPHFPEFQVRAVVTRYVNDAVANGPASLTLRSSHLWLRDTPAATAGKATVAKATAPRSAPALRFDIPAATLDVVIAAYEKVTGVKVTLADPSLGALASPGVSGLLTADDALVQLLVGTGVKHQFLSAQAATLSLAGVSESLEVSGSGPRQRVASPKYAATLRETPQTVQVISRDTFEQQGATTLSDALRNVPGITLQAGEGGGASSTAGDMFNMRGFNASNSLFVDGVRDDGLIARDVFNLEQVEVFSGPTGSDVGRGTASGYVNMATKQPRALARYGGLVSFGTSDQRRVQVDLNQPLMPGRTDSWLAGSAVRLNALWQDSGIPGRDYAEREARAVAPSIALGLNSRVRVIGQAQIMRQDNLPDYGIPAAAWPDGPLTATGFVAPGDVRQANYYGSPDLDYDDASQDSYTGRLELDVNPNFTLRNQTRYNKTERKALITSLGAFTPATGLVTLTRQGNERENSITSNQTNVAANVKTGSISHALRGGLEITSESQFAPSLTGTGTRAPVDIYHPDPSSPVADLALARTGAFTDGQTNTAAIYAFDTVDLGTRVTLTGGIRYEHYSTDYLAVDATGLATTDLDASAGLWSGKAGIVFNVTQAGNVYLSYGTTKTPPGSANFALSTQENNANNPNVDPQTSSNIEVGTKWDVLGSRLSLTAAGFHTKNENVIFTLDSTTVPPLFNYDDAQEVNGAVVGASGRITSQWDVTASFALLDSENQSQNAANAGRRLTLTPKFSGSLWTTYRFPFRFTVGGGVRHTDDVFVNAGNTITTPGFNLLDLIFQYDFTSQLSLRVNVNNATDNVYIRSINNNGGRYNPGNPRSALLTLIANY